MKRRFSILLLCLAMLTGCFHAGSNTSKPPRAAFVATGSTATVSSQHETMGPLELQAAVMAFADTTNSRLSQASGIIEGIGTPQARLTAARMMVFDVSSNVEIAAGPYPGVALLDMIVTTSLRRMVWEEYWIPVIFGKKAEPALEDFQDAEREIWELAARLMTPDQLDELAKIILRWRRANPRQVNVNYVRLDDFGDLGLKPSMRRLHSPGGLFASVKQAAMVAQDMKVSIDRAFYLMSRMQLIINFQVKLAYLEMMFQPEADGLIDTSKKFADMTERYARIAEDLPNNVGKEAGTLIELIFAKLETNTTRTLAGVNKWQDQALKEIMVNVSNERQAAINQTLNGLQEQQATLFSRFSELIDNSRGSMKDTLDHAFLLGALLIVIFFAALTLYQFLVVRPMNRRKKSE